eukprot:8787210-Pyramimonas_sp.AAC.1
MFLGPRSVAVSRSCVRMTSIWVNRAVLRAYTYSPLGLSLAGGQGEPSRDGPIGSSLVSQHGVPAATIA